MGYGVPFLVSEEEKERIVDLNVILKTLYKKRPGQSVSKKKILRRGDRINNLITKYSIDTSSLPRLHKSEAESMRDLPHCYSEQFRRAKRKEIRLESQLEETYKDYLTRLAFESYFCLEEVKKIGYNQPLSKYKKRSKKTRLSYYKYVEPDSDDTD